jgi:protease PrsW
MWICAALLVMLAFATLIHLSVLASMRPDVASVFYRALALSSVLAIVPLAVVWFLDRRERESPWLFAAAFLWGGFIATGLALPFNSAFFMLVDAWVTQHPVLRQVLGPDAAMILAAPISAPIAEELAKALGVLLLFWRLRAEFDNMRDGIVYGALVGLGFNWFEAALYVAQGYAEYGVAPYGLQLGSRYAFLGLGGHALFTGIFWRVPRACNSDRAQVDSHSRANRRAGPGHRGTHAEQHAAAPRRPRGRCRRQPVNRLAKGKCSAAGYWMPVFDGMREDWS